MATNDTKNAAVVELERQLDKYPVEVQKTSVVWVTSLWQVWSRIYPVRKEDEDLSAIVDDIEEFFTSVYANWRPKDLQAIPVVAVPYIAAGLGVLIVAVADKIANDPLQRHRIKDLVDSIIKRLKRAKPRWKRKARKTPSPRPGHPMGPMIGRVLRAIAVSSTIIYVASTKGGQDLLSASGKMLEQTPKVVSNVGSTVKDIAKYVAIGLLTYMFTSLLSKE